MNKAAGTIWNEAMFDIGFYTGCFFIGCALFASGYMCGFSDAHWKPRDNVIDLAAEREKRRMVG